MANNDLTATQTHGRTAGTRGSFMIWNTLDCSENNQAQNDVAQMLNVYADWFVRKVWVEVVTAEGGTLTFDVGDGSDVDGYLDGVDGNATGVSTHAPLSGSVTWDPASLVDGAGETKAVTVTGAVVGDYVTGIANGVDVQEMLVSASVSAADTVEIRLQNETTGTIDLASSTWAVTVESGTQAYSRTGKLYAAADTIDIKLLNAADAAKIRIKALVDDFSVNHDYSDKA